MEFKVGDDVVVVRRDHWKRRSIVRRHNVEKVYKTGHVIVNQSERFRQDGSEVNGRGSFTLHHWTQALQDESDETARIRGVLVKRAQFVRKLDHERDDALVDKVMQLIPDEVFKLLEMKE